MKVVVTRPEPDASRLAERLRGLGYAPLVCPAMSIRFDPGVQPASNAYQAILITSANGLRALEQTRNADQLKSIPVVAVGATSAKLATSLGYHPVLEADGNVRSLAELAANRFDPGKGPLLYVTGTSRAGDLKADLETRGFIVERLELYTAQPLDRMPGEITSELQAEKEAVVLLYSARTAQVWARLLQQAGLARIATSLRHICLSQAVADQLRSSLQGPLSIEVVNTPGDDAMLAVLEERKSTVRPDTPPQNPM